MAGPLVVGAVILPEEEKEWYADLKDSKKLSVKKRERLSKFIQEEAVVGLGWVPCYELDEVGISEALRIATRRAVKEVQSFRVPFSQIIIDGKINFLKNTSLERYVSTVVKADNLIREVSAASIAAKVARDEYMIGIASKYPGYGFEQHVGYGTSKHIAAIRRLGICLEHRRSFEPIKSMVGYEKPKKNVLKNTTSVGKKGEQAAAEYLVRHGHEIVARNHKTYFYEIDIVSVCNGKIYFTEVKYRKNRDYGGGMMAIDAKKQQQMCYAAEAFLKFKKEFSGLEPILAVADVEGESFEIKDWFVLI